MAAKYFAILTNLGAAKLANATALGTQLEITHMAVGDGGGGLPIPNPAQTALIGERRRAAINLLTIDPLNNSQIISEQVIPEDVGGWWIREVGLFDKDGSLVAIANCPETYKPQLQEGSGRTQTIRVILIVSSTQSVSLKIDPSVVLATRKYVDDNVIEVRAYVDKVMESHIAALHPHKQYALVDNAPVTLDSLRKIAIAMNNDPNLFNTLSMLIAGKMSKNQNGADIPDVALFLQNLGLKNPSDRNGITAVQAGTGYVLIPVKVGSLNKTLIFQWGKLQLGTGAADYNCDIVFPIPYTDACFAIAPGSGVLIDDYEKNAAYRTLKQSVSIGLPSRYGADAQLFVENGAGHARYVMWISVGF